MTAELNTSEEALICLKSNYSSAEKKVELLSSQTDQIQKQLKERKEIFLNHVSTQEKTKEQEVRLAKLRAQKDSISTSIKNMQKKYDANILKSLDAKEMKTKLDLERKENDVAEKEKVEPAQLKLIEILKEKELSAGTIENLHESCQQIQHKQQTLQENNNMTLKNVASRLKEYHNSVEKKEQELVDIDTSCKKIEESALSEIQEHETIKISFEEAVKAEELNMQETKQNQHQIAQKKIKELEMENKRIQDVESFKLVVLKRAEKIITETEKHIAFLNNAEICLDDELNLIAVDEAPTN